jgi:ABC-2 type transport system permease protein
LYKEILHRIRIVLIETRLAIESELVYRFRIVVWVIADVIQPLLLATLWIAVGNASDIGYSTNMMITYYFFIAIVTRFTEDWSLTVISNEIYSGGFYKYMLKPFNYMYQMLGLNLATKIPVLFVGGVLLSGRINVNLSLLNVFFFAISIIVGFLLTFIFSNTFALFTIFFKQVVGLRAIYLNMLSILSGEYIPLFVLPGLIFGILKYLPFRFMLSFPIEVITGMLSKSEMSLGVLISFIWLIILFFVYRFVYIKAVNQFESDGL